MTNSPKEYPMDNLTIELAECLVEMRNFADIGEIPAAAYMVRADAVLDRYVDALRTPEPKMTINLKDYEGKSVVITLRSGWRVVSTVHPYNYTSRDHYPYVIEGTCFFNDGRVLMNTESMSDIVDIELVDEEPRETSEPVITRVEVITDTGREYVNWEKDNVITTSLQDEGRTLKIFVTQNPEEPMYPKQPKPINMVEIESKRWATALSGLIDELGGDSPALWEWEGKTPTPEKVVEYLRENIQYIADGELEACCAVMEMNGEHVSGNVLRAIRRPQPTLKSQALRDFETVRKHSDLLPEILDTIEKALKSIPE